MGHGALFERYDKPNYKLHFAILVAIIVTSVVLSLQVNKNKDATDIVAMKQPVPIDSIASRSELPASENEAQISEAALIPKVAETASPFIAEMGKSNASVTLASATVGTEPIHANTILPQTEESVATDPLLSQLTGTVDNLENENIPTESVAAELAPETNSQEINQSDTVVQLDADAVKTLDSSEADVAEDGAQEPAQIAVADAVINEDVSESANTLQVSNENVDKSKLEKLRNASSISLDDVYNKQQQNFLNTLAKSVEKNNEADNTVKKIREAIRDDKPIETATDAVDAAPVKAKQKVASLDKKTLSVKKSEERKKALTRITRGELNNILSQFTYYYNSGDITRLMNLFNEKATSNGQSSKKGIANDYANLFGSTHARRLMLKNIKWNLDSAKASGAADFEVVIQAKNGNQRSSLKGVISITAVKGDDGIYITRLFHEVH